MENVLVRAEPLMMTGVAEASPPVPVGRRQPDWRLSLAGAVLAHAGLLALMLAGPDLGYRQHPSLPEVVAVSLAVVEEPAAVAEAIQPAVQREAAPRPVSMVRRDRHPVSAAPAVQPPQPPAAPEVAQATPVSSPHPASGQPEVARTEEPTARSGGPGRPGPAVAAPTGAEIAAVPARPRSRDNRPPPYPEQARRLRLEGTVVLEALVGGGGTVDDLAVHASSGHQLLDAAALRAVRNWLFEPGRRNGLPVTTKVMVPVRFALR